MIRIAHIISFSYCFYKEKGLSSSSSENQYFLNVPDFRSAIFKLHRLFGTDINSTSLKNASLSRTYKTQVLMHKMGKADLL